VVISESETTLVCDHIIIATGSRPRELPVPGAEHAITSTQFLDLEELPDSMICIGGGYISLEFAFIAGLSGCNVEILQKGNRILPQFPQTLVDSVLSVSHKHQVTTRTGVNVTGISKKKDSLVVHTAEQGDKEAELVLSAIGRVPNIEKLNLNAVGIEYSSRGIAVNEYMESSMKGVYAVGDCAATAMLSPVADMEAGIAVDHILNPGSTSKPVQPVPSVVFSYPPMASIGISARDAEKKNLDVEVHTGQAEKWATYRRINAHTAFYEIVIDKQTDLILGAHLAGAQAGEMINLYALAMQHGIKASQLKSYPWAYPTYTSDVKYTL
jgi:glutathione reductase (NADPH)